MNHAIMIELHFFGACLLWGILLLVFYDILRIFRRVVIHNWFFISIEDIIYWVICSVLIFHMMYKQNNGIIRGFAILAMLLGMILYKISVSELLVDMISTFINTIIGFVIKIIGKIISVITWPFRFLFSKLNKFLKWILKKLKKILHHIVKPLKKLFKSSKIMVSKNEKGD